MKFPNPEEHWLEWGNKMGDYWYCGNLERYWLKFMRVHRHWWRFKHERAL